MAGSILKTKGGFVINRPGHVLFVPVKADGSLDWTNSIRNTAVINTITVTNSKTKTGNKIAAQETCEYQKQLLSSNHNRDSENQAVSYCYGSIECKRYDEKQAPCKGNSRTEIL